jgi:transcriptional regulator with PAS, ATPase and Fis domain
VAAAVEAALVAGRARIVDERGRRWVLVGLVDPLPAVLALPVPPRCEARVAERDAWAVAERARDRVLERMARDPLTRLVATRPSLAELVAEIERLAPTGLPLLVLGETGTGKEVAARAIHEASKRRGRFVAENCASIPEGLLEAELFGTRRGAYTGAEGHRDGLVVEAHDGTLFLDEIGDLPSAAQAKILRVLQEREVRPLGASRAVAVEVRLVAATHHDLPGLVRRGRFRRDLFFRIAGATLMLPPLRDTPDDIAPLAAALLDRARRDRIGPGRRLAPEALDALRALELPGNVRELDHRLRRAAALAATEWIPRELVASHDALATFHGTDDSLEARAILRALREENGVKARAARRLGWTRQKLYRRLGALGLDARSVDDERASTKSRYSPSIAGASAPASSTTATERSGEASTSAVHSVSE